ncbi:SpaH/EbpB family LPXTG-anchored major pilin [Lapidilactobacillus bayanensis]|uniref:SpaH/EbpB family LPXTG-anchored major pilin n=1 Tax=Lapidilactobacillus bayanensis TaxID=2485998 RepID=UPI000F78EDBA|nr:SpaH/EbpB family LPXTG-anchored major pilin [Lapidilactobacillus bayanensis]
MKNIKKLLIIIFSLTICSILAIPTRSSQAASDNVDIVLHKLALIKGANEDSASLLKDYEGIGGAKFAAYDVADEFYQLRAKGVSVVDAQKQIASATPTNTPIMERTTVSSGAEKGAAHFNLPRKTADGKYAIYLFREITTDSKDGQALSQVIVLPVYDQGKELTTIDLYSKNGELPDEPTEPEKPIEPTIDKKVAGQQGGYQFGDHINYQIAVTVPSDLSNKKKFVISDSNISHNLIPDLQTLRVMQGSTNLTKLFKQTRTADGFSLQLQDFKALSKYAGKQIVVSYTSALVVNQENVSQSEFLNTATLTTDDQTLNSQAVVKTGYKKFIKVDLNNQKKKLAGATFIIRNNQKQYLAKRNNRYYWVNNRHEANIVQLTSQTDGSFMINGLRNGTYYLVETKAPTGYHMGKDAIAFKIDAQKNQVQTILKVVNQQIKRAGLLPQTGEQIQQWLTVIGLVVIALVLILFRRYKKEGNK